MAVFILKRPEVSKAASSKHVNELNFHIEAARMDALHKTVGDT